MDKNEYVKRREELQRELAALKDEYIKTNSKIPSGTRVKVKSINDKEQYGIVLGYSCHWDDVEPIVAKMNKDGSPHATARIYIWHDSQLEIIED